jgi:ketosteroid isomerase-like protein
MSNRALIERFYTAFARRDSAAMAACYASDITFGDPVFPDLRGERAGAMWRMLLSAPGEIEVTLLEHDADETTGSARWQARYVFSGTGRPVLNDVRARFRFADGLIVEHRDHFDFHRWSRQALGPVGLLLGWTPLLRASVRRKAAQRLAKVA